MYVFKQYGMKHLRNLVKGKERKSNYIALFWPRWYTQSAQAWITQFYLQTTSCLPFLRGVHQMSPPQQLRQQTSNCSSLLTYRPRKDERLSWPSWLTYSGWFTHISNNNNNNNKPISNAPDASVTGPEARRTLRNITVRVDH